MCIDPSNKKTKPLILPPREAADLSDPIDRNKLDITHNSLLEILDNFNKSSLVNITKQDLIGFPLMEWFHVNDGVKIRRRKELFNGTLVFDTEMIQGAKFGYHFHSDLTEQCDVLEGELYDLMSQTTYKSGDSVVFIKGFGHIPVALKYTVLRVYFD